MVKICLSLNLLNQQNEGRVKSINFKCNWQTNFSIMASVAMGQRWSKAEDSRKENIAKHKWRQQHKHVVYWLTIWINEICSDFGTPAKHTHQNLSYSCVCVCVYFRSACKTTYICTLSLEQKKSCKYLVFLWTLQKFFRNFSN